MEIEYIQAQLFALPRKGGGFRKIYLASEMVKCNRFEIHAANVRNLPRHPVPCVVLKDDSANDQAQSCNGGCPDGFPDRIMDDE